MIICDDEDYISYLIHVIVRLSRRQLLNGRKCPINSYKRNIIPIGCRAQEDLFKFVASFNM